jgi:hypothetical protein
MPILVADLVLGVVLVATVAIAARRSSASAASSERQRAVGWLLVALPLPLAVVLEAVAPLPPALAQLTFVAGVVAFAAGSLLVVRYDGGDGLRDGGESETPPWWPEFEREFRAYARSSTRPRARV